MKTFENRKSLFRNTLVAAALAVGLGATGPLFADAGDAAQPQPSSDSVGAAISDSGITAVVKAKFMGEDRLKNAQISVSTTDGAVTLTGTVENAESKSAAVELAKGVQGVKSVDSNALSIPSAAVTASPGTQHLAQATPKPVSDSWITAKVKSELLTDSVGKGLDVSVTTKQGVVMLSGTLANPDAINHVKSIAERVDGVKSVDTSGLSASGG
jgi:hyperosmotically inducible protein